MPGSGGSIRFRVPTARESRPRTPVPIAVVDDTIKPPTTEYAGILVVPNRRRTRDPSAERGVAEDNAAYLRIASNCVPIP